MSFFITILLGMYICTFSLPVVDKQKVWNNKTVSKQDKIWIYSTEFLFGVFYKPFLFPQNSYTSVKFNTFDKPFIILQNFHLLQKKLQGNVKNNCMIFSMKSQNTLSKIVFLSNKNSFSSTEKITDCQSSYIICKNIYLKIKLT